MDKNKTNSQRALRLGNEPVGSLLLKFSIPAIVGMMVNALYNIVDRIFIGRGVNSIAIGGVYLGMPMMLILMAFSMLVGIGGNTLVSIRLGENNKDEADKIASNSLMLLIIIGVSLGILGNLFLEPLLRAFGASDSNIGYSMDYMRVILLGAPFQAIGFGMNNFIRGEGNPKIAMMTMLIGAILNMILDPLFIFVFKMGVQGAAIATIISQFISAMWVLRYFFTGSSILDLKKEYLKLKLEYVKKIFGNGFAPFSMQIAASMVTALYNTNLQIHGGDLATSSMGVINSVAMMVLMPVFGINQGSQPIMGYNFGARQYDRVKKTLLYASLMATAITTSGFLIVQFFPEAIILLFTGSEGAQSGLLPIAVPGIKTLLFMFPIVGFQIVSTSYFQATGKPKQAMLLSLSRQVLVLIPALLILPPLLGLRGVWMAGPLADFTASLITAILVFHSIKNLN
ncbi:MATE family efflux transporter [Gudongella sp. DL1XJH-153]|uniref:MATE family efflux transporter n=1 Tax=Gudongella sp. DL1XJH-153 TaxID=3409804 RepID=UPI003BB6CC66